MKMNKNEFTGTTHVFRFTLKQLICSKANCIAMGMIVLMALAALPITTLVSGGAFQSQKDMTVQTVYVQNETDYELDFVEIQKLLAEEGALRVNSLKAAEDFTEEFYQQLNAEELCVHLYKDVVLGMFSVDVVHSDDSVFAEEYDVLYSLQNAFIQAFNSARYQALGATAEQLQTATSQITTDVDYVDEYMAREQVSWDVQYGIQLAYDIVILMISVLSISYIIRSVTEEKASKLVEMLVVTIKPLALLMGKILAVMVYMVFQFVVYIGAFLASYLICRNFMDMSVLTDSMQAMGFSSAMFRIGGPLVIIVLVSLIIAYLSYALLSGLFGACCSTTEDIQSAMTVPTMICMACYFVSIMATAFTSHGAQLALSLVPFVSGFCMPVQYLLGNIGFGTVILSWLIQLVVVAALLWFSSHIYRDLIIYRGGRIKMGQMIRMARGSSKD